MLQPRKFSSKGSVLGSNLNKNRNLKFGSKNQNLVEDDNQSMNSDIMSQGGIKRIGGSSEYGGSDQSFLSINK